MRRSIDDIITSVTSETVKTWASLASQLWSSEPQDLEADLKLVAFLMSFFVWKMAELLPL